MPTVVNNLQIVLQSPPSAAGRRAADQGVADALTSVLSDNTRRVYKTQWRLFTDWCGDVGLRSLLADALTVARYLAVRAGDGAALSPCAFTQITPVHRSPVTSTDPALAPVSPRARSRVPDCGGPLNWHCLALRAQCGNPRGVTWASRTAVHGDTRMTTSLATANRLYFGDNLDILRQYVADESVDLIYLDPPFNSNATYNVLFREHSGEESAAQITAFEDTWHWGWESETAFQDVVTQGPDKVGSLLAALRQFLGQNDMMAYLTMMAQRLVELHRVLKPTGGIYLHCDPTASHYLKLLMDAVFDARNFRNEIVWLRTMAKGLMSRQLPNNHDVILSYRKSNESTWLDFVHLGGVGEDVGELSLNCGWGFSAVGFQPSALYNQAA